MSGGSVGSALSRTLATPKLVVERLWRGSAVGRTISGSDGEGKSETGVRQAIVSVA